MERHLDETPHPVRFSND